MTATLSLRGLARLMGVDEKSVRKAMLAGVFSSAAVSRDAHGAPMVLDATLAVDEWQKSGRKQRGSAPTPPAQRATEPSGEQTPVHDVPGEIELLLARVRQLRQGSAPVGDADPIDGAAVPDVEKSPTYVKAQTEAMLERGRKLRMENDLREGSLVEANQASKVAFEFSRTVREAVLNVPARVAAQLAAETDGARVHTLLEAALRQALESTAATLDAAPPGDRGSLVAVGD